MKQLRKKSLQLSENQLLDVIKLIVEKFEGLGYGQEDYVDVALIFFKKWLVDTHNINLDKFPLSFLIKKYLNEFAKELEVLLNDWEGTVYKLTSIGQKIVSSGKHSLPSLKEEGLFTEKYKKAIDWYISRGGLPDYYKLNIIEQNPYELKFLFEVDFEKMIMSNQKALMDKYTILKNFEQFITDITGLEIGSPEYGEVEINRNAEMVYTGLDEWSKNVFQKTIKKRIKEDPVLKNSIQRIQFSAKPWEMPKITIITKSYWNRRGETLSSSAVASKVREIIQGFGINTDNLRVGW